MESSSQSAKSVYPTVAPYLIVHNADLVIEFLKNAFDFSEGVRHLQPDGKIMHAELRLGDSMVMLSEASEQYPPNPTMIHLFLNNCDSYYKRALEAGASSVMEPKDQEYGHRSAGVRDASGNQWWIASDIKS
jgi:PhnB protein